MTTKTGIMMMKYLPGKSTFQSEMTSAAMGRPEFLEAVKAQGLR